MKMYFFVCLLAYAVAEPPVGDSYAPARSNHDHGIDIQRSLSQEYGAPPFGARSQNYQSIDARSQHPTYDTSFRSAPSQEYGAPSSRSGLSQEYGQPNFRTAPSQVYGSPNSRSLSQQYGPPTSRNAGFSEYNPQSVRSQDYSGSNALSQEYGTPQSRSGPITNYNTDIPSDSYGAPLQRSSSLHGRSGFRSTPSQDYGTPSQRNFDQFPSEKYSQSNFRNAQSFNPISRDHAKSRFNSQNSISSTRGFQSSLGSQSQNYAASRSSLSQYAVPSGRNFDSYSPTSISSSYLPSSRTVSQTYGAPDSRSLSSEYGLPESRSGINTNAFASSFDSARSISSKYGAPSGREAMPSDQYGLPEQYDALSSQGYSYARNALDELLNQEPANYDFGYKVNDYITGSDFGHTETRQENKAEGSYFVVLPDGTKQVVEYEADERGFKPRISVEPAETRSGYDDNAADLVRSGDGPY